MYLNIQHPELRWGTHHFKKKNLNFPKSFFWGTASAAHQVEGNCNNNNWFVWENSANKDGVERIKKFKNRNSM